MIILLGDITKNLIFYGAIAEHSSINSYSKSKKPPKMKLNIPISTKSKMNDIYKEIFQPSENILKDKPAIITSLLQYTNRSNKKTIVAREQASVNNNSKIARAKSQLCSLLGEEDSSKKSTKNKMKLKDADRLLLIKNEMDQMLNKDNSNKVNVMPVPQQMPIAIPQPSIDRLISRGRIESERKGIMRNGESLNMMNEDNNSYSSKYRKEGRINKTDLLFQLKLGLTKI